MTPTLHKILVHGSTIIEHALVPIGQLSEEAAEARNKHFRQYRQDYARKFSRTSCNMDVLNRLLLSSDPMLSCERLKERKNKEPFSKEELQFILLPSDLSLHKMTKWRFFRRKKIITIRQPCITSLFVKKKCTYFIYFSFFNYGAVENNY